MDPDKLDAVFRQRPALHRFPGSMARRVQALCQAIVKDYRGDAGAVWREAADGDELAARIKKLPGFGDMKVKILVAVLAKKFDVRPRGKSTPPIGTRSPTSTRRHRWRRPAR
jgi:uncharacterized HhH-GPD family protein